MGGCKWPGCQVKAPRYTRKGLKPYRGEYCLKHAKCFYPSRELVNMNLPQCKAPSYCDERAKWGRKEEDGTARATACELHREDGMVVGGHRYCANTACLSRAHFAYPWSDKLEYSCRKHALPSMLRVDSQEYRDARAEYEASNGAKKRGREESSEGASDFYEEQEGDRGDRLGYQESIQHKYHSQPQQQDQQLQPQQYQVFLERPLKQEIPPLPLSLGLIGEPDDAHQQEAAQAILGLNFQPNPQRWSHETTTEAN